MPKVSFWATLLLLCAVANFACPAKLVAAQDYDFSEYSRQEIMDFGIQCSAFGLLVSYQNRESSSPPLLIEPYQMRLLMLANSIGPEDEVEKQFSVALLMAGMQMQSEPELFVPEGGLDRLCLSLVEYMLSIEEYADFLRLD